ncbi:MAG: hypothetical protein A3G76_14305 [Acidobacteria bacterium RIFCSPLOWO2_12_FULL_65_11]|nr:MAG: hypothetical protein A3H95_02225 [Acidobacteria bacterium RIFCSPLOWO2_02_FULL_64_15]OFW30187.1 MAG: hypothetical protein A3G76_14305 [Acidobacteria bacterium RIFCSPLOWO2_12_FULL_65_11]
MIPGLSGHLVSEAFLEAYLPTIGNAETNRLIDRVYRELVAWRRGSAALGPASSVHAMLQVGAAPLVAALGFDPPSDIRPADRSIAAVLRGGPRPTALLVASWGDRLDPLWRTAVTEALARSAPWCLLFNGTHLRAIDAARLFARRHIEFDLDLTLDDPRAFAAFLAVVSAHGLTNSPSGDLEPAPPSDVVSAVRRTATVPQSDVVSAFRRTGTPLHVLVEASDRHASGVCRSLKDGVLAASADVLNALVRPQTTRHPFTLDDTFDQALTIVYRIVFLLFAEARALVPLWHPVYRDSYSVQALREAAEHPQGAPGLWDALRAMARLAHAGCRAGDLRVTPFNGRLFAPARTPLAERRDLDDGAAQRAILALSTRPSTDRAGREPIAYRDLGVEQLGAVYETLLDYVPHVTSTVRLKPDTTKGHGRGRRPSVTLIPGSGVRKATGTFYTPQPIAEYLVRRTLGPLVRDATPDRILQLRVVDPSMGSGAFLVAACRYLAGAYEAALIQTGGCRPGDLGDQDRAAVRRSIAERCLYGVDLNPVAVQLARLSLWLTTLAADRPLSFLDHRLAVGDSLLGAWVASLGRLPHRARGRRASVEEELPLFDEPRFPGFNDALGAAVPVRFSLESMPNDTIESVRAKERALATINSRDSALTRWKRVADLWCASWFQSADRGVPPAAFGALSDAILTGGGSLPPQATRDYLCASEEVAGARRFFHWELEFPEVFFAPDGARLANGGFDAVIGNPPWDMIRADTGTTDVRSHAREGLALMMRFTRDAGIYRAQSDGHANRYQLFVERARSLARAGGRLGLVLPWGLAADRGSASLRRLLLARSDVDTLVGFDNRRGVFPIHRGVRFLLLTASTGRPTSSIACRFGLDDPSELESIGEEPAASSRWFVSRLTPAVLDRLSGPDLTIPWVQTPTDLAIAERAAALFPSLGSPSGWSVRFGRELNATDDRGSFCAPGAGLPIVEGKQIQPFDVDLGSARHAIRSREAHRLLPDGRYLRPRLAYRDIAGATNRVTLIAAILPAGCVSTHTLFCLRSPLALRDQQYLCGLFNSFVVNFLVRLQVTLHVTTATVEHLPIPTRDAAPAAVREVASLARLLTRRGRHLDPLVFARLQARVAELYQLTTDEFAHVLSTFPLIPQEARDAAFRLFATGTRRSQR